MSKTAELSALLDQEADRLLLVIRNDLMTVARWTRALGPLEPGEESQLHNAIASNCRQLAVTLEKGGTPDPYPIFRHGENETAENTLQDVVGIVATRLESFNAEGIFCKDVDRESVAHLQAALLEALELSKR